MIPAPSGAFLVISDVISNVISRVLFFAIFDDSQENEKPWKHSVSGAFVVWVERFELSAS